MPTDSMVGVVKAVSGELRQGDRILKVGDTIAVDEDFEVRGGKAAIEIPGVGVLHLATSARGRVRSRSKFTLLVGKLFALITPERTDDFSVETPNAVCGVRGTRFVVEVSTGRTRVAVTEGRVAFGPRAKPRAELVLNAGQASEVREQSEPTAPASIDVAEELADFGETLAGESQPAPRPAVRSDRKAFEKHEAEGRRKAKELEEEAETQKRELQKEEKKVRENLEKGREEVEKDLEKDMNMKGSLKPKRGTLKGKSIRDREDSETKDFLD